MQTQSRQIGRFSNLLFCPRVAKLATSYRVLCGIFALLFTIPAGAQQIGQTITLLAGRDYRPEQGVDVWSWSELIAPNGRRWVANDQTPGPFTITYDEVGTWYLTTGQQGDVGGQTVNSFGTSQINITAANQAPSISWINTTSTERAGDAYRIDARGSDPENPVSYQPPPQHRILAVTERNSMNVAPQRLTNVVS